MIEIKALAVELWVAGEVASDVGRIYNCDLREGSETRIRLNDRNQAAWGWWLILGRLQRLDDQDGHRPGWCGVEAAVLGIDGSLYAPFRPFLLYASPWVHPSLLVWPDAWAGPIVATVRVPGPLPKADKVDPGPDQGL